MVSSEILVRYSDTAAVFTAVVRVVYGVFITVDYTRYIGPQIINTNL